MGLFGGQPKTQSYLGIDIGNSSLKLVELQNIKNRPKLLTYGYVEQKNEILTSNSAAAKDSIVKALKKVQTEARTKSTQVVASLPSYTVFMSIIHLPQNGEKGIDKSSGVGGKKVCANAA